MAFKKEVIVLSVVFDTEETYGESAASAIDHRLFNEEGIKEWSYKVKSEETLETTEEDLEDDE